MCFLTDLASASRGFPGIINIAQWRTDYVVHLFAGVRKRDKKVLHLLRK